jgi:GTP-binding protein HflX
MIELAQHGKEKCILIGVPTRMNARSDVTESLEELGLLADTAGAEVVGHMIQERDRFEPATLIGKGKVEQLRRRLGDENIPLVIFDDDLTAVQVRNLERQLECKVLDRSGLILDIFASRAKTNEAKTQVELAQLEYLLPRLTRQWTHLSKQFGGIGTKGPGETQIETDRRLIRTRISHLKEKLERISQQRFTQRKGRTKHTRAALVGYTNAGKSTLLNFLSGSEVFVENRLFATLDPTTRLVQLNAAVSILMTDTVGFIRKLPHHLVASFKSTLEEIGEADLLLHVVDVSSPYFEDQIRVVLDTLESLGASEIPMLMAYNKIDRLQDRGIFSSLAERFPNHVFISAQRGINITGLREEVIRLLEKEFVVEQIVVPQSDQRRISKIYDMGEVLERSYEDASVLMKIRLHRRDRERLQQMIR